MNFSINRQLFIKYLNIASLAVASKSPMKLLEGIKIEAKNNKLTLTSNCTDYFIVINIKDESLNIIEEGETLVIAKVFVDLIKAFDSEVISLFLIEDKSLMLKADRKEYLINIMDVKDYPLVKIIDDNNNFSINKKVFIEAVSQTIQSCSVNNTKQPLLTGVYIKYSNNELSFTATNSYRLSQKNINCNLNCDNFDFVVPAKSLDSLLKVCENTEDENITICFDKNKILVKFSNLCFETRLLDGIYPDVSNIIPRQAKSHICFIKEELLTALHRTSLLSPSDKASERELNFTAISFKINQNNELELSSANNQGNGKEIVTPTRIDLYEPLKLGVSSKYLVDALRSIPSEEVIFSFLNSARQFTIKALNDDSLIQLILPINLE